MKCIHVIVVGCGGTGGVFLKEFGRFMAASQKMPVILTMIDGDRVEEKNLSRQPYAMADLNQFKATSLSEAMRCVYGLENIFSFPVYLDHVGQLVRIAEEVEKEVGTREKLNKSGFLTVLIGAVDNHRARQVLHDYFNLKEDILYFDAANEWSNGEVVFACKQDGVVLAPPRAFYFPEVLTDQSKRASEQSCGVVNQSSPQHQCTNIQAANLMLSKLTRLLCGEEVKFGITYFDIESEDMLFREWKEK